jgi:hypothetical protein
MVIYNPNYKNQFHCLALQYVLWDIISIIFMIINKKHLLLKINENDLYYQEIVGIFGFKKAFVRDYDNRVYIVLFKFKK